MDELRFETYGVEGEPHAFRLYECQHITQKSYPIEGVIPIGPTANLLVCKHCWYHIRGMVADEIIREQLKRMTVPELREAITAGRLRTENQSITPVERIEGQGDT